MPSTPLLQSALVTLPFVIFYLVQLVHHRMWRDEFNAFAIAVASPTVTSLIEHIHYEGHPWLWYALLWGVAQVTTNPLGMKVLEGVIGVGIYLVIGLASPFSRLEKVLIFLGYFVAFEYTVMSRMYGLLLLLLVVYLNVRVAGPVGISSQRNRLLLGALLLGLMASTDSLGIMLSGALLCEYVYQHFVVQPDGEYTRRSAFVWAGLLYVVLLSLAIWSARPKPDVSWRTTGRPFSSAPSKRHLLEAAENYVVLPYTAARPFNDGFFWNPSSEIHLKPLALALVMVLAAYWFIFRRHPSLLLLLGLAIVGGTLFGHLIIHGSMRHFGVTFLAFLASLWILRSKVSRLPMPAYVLLAFLAIGGVIADAQQWRRPFSEAESTAAWIKANGLQNIPIAGTPDTTVASLAQLLHHPIYMLDCNCSDTFLLFSSRRDQFDRSEIPERILSARRNLNVPHFLFIEDTPLPPKSIALLAGEGLAVYPLARFAEAQAGEENFFVYDVTDRPK